MAKESTARTFGRKKGVWKPFLILVGSTRLPYFWMIMFEYAQEHLGDLLED